MKNISLILLSLFFLFSACKENDSINTADELEPTQSMQIVLLEKTGTWCGACPNGAEILNDLVAEFEDQVVPIAVHGSNGDPMQISCYSNFRQDRFSSGFPSFFITEDRVSTSLNATRNRVNTKLAVEVDAAIAFRKTVNEDNIVIETRTKFFNASQDEYFLSVFITENDIDGGTGSGAYKQTSGGSDYKHEHVLRASATDDIFWGELIASEPAENSSFDNTYTIEKESDWVDENLHVAAVLWRYDANGTNNYIFVNAIGD